MATSSPRQTGRVLIAGGSIAGLFAGVLLHRAGWDVAIFERAPTGLESQGAGLVQQADLTRALRAAGVDAVAPLGVTATERVTLDADGGFLHQMRSPQTQHAWDAVYRALRDRFPDDRYHLNAAVQDVREHDGSVRLTLASEQVETGDLLIAADGTLSAVRARLMPAVTPRYAGYVAWRGLVPEDRLSPRAHDRLAGRFGFFRYPGSHILGYLIPGADGETAPGQRRYNWVWYRQVPAGAALDRLLTGTDGVRRPLSMPPDRLDPAAASAMLAAAKADLPGPFADAVAATDGPFLQAIMDLESPRMATNRIALVGDAAFVVRPHTAMGVDKAAGDALGLAEALTVHGIDVPAALAAWEPARLAHGRAVAAHGRRLGAPLEPAPVGKGFTA